MKALFLIFWEFFTSEALDNFQATIGLKTLQMTLGPKFLCEKCCQLCFGNLVFNLANDCWILTKNWPKRQLFGHKNITKVGNTEYEWMSLFSFILFKKVLFFFSQKPLWKLMLLKAEETGPFQNVIKLFWNENPFELFVINLEERGIGKPQ